jgi:GAF domain-containing protein
MSFEARESSQVAAGLAGVLAEMGAVLLSGETVDSAVQLVTGLAVEAIPGSVGAGVTLVDPRGKRSTAASDALVERADALQYELDAGPCLTAWRDRVVVRIDDVPADPRWRQWADAVAPLGVSSVLSVPLLSGADCLGAMKVYALRPHAFDDQAERLLHLFAEQAAILLANTQTVSQARRLTSQLTVALETRDVIGQAKGILMARGAGSSAAAFSMLVESSQRSNTKLHEVARRLVASVSGDDEPPTDQQAERRARR